MKFYPLDSVVGTFLSVKAANTKRLGVIERHPHYVTRRYAHFAASLLALHSGLDDLAVGIGGEEMLLNDLGTLRVEVRRGLQSQRYG